MTKLQESIPELDTVSLHRLEEILAKSQEYSLPWLHGMLVAIASSPVPIMPTDWLEDLIENIKPDPNDLEDLSCISLILINRVMDDFEDETLLPLLSTTSFESWPETVDQDALRQWCKGHILGTSYFEEFLDAAMEGEEQSAISASMHLIAVFGIDDDRADELMKNTDQGTPLSQLKQIRSQLLPSFPKIVRSFADFCHEAADDITDNEPFEQNPTVGRNDPCVCGSGKKYKKCCLQ